MHFLQEVRWWIKDIHPFVGLGQEDGMKRAGYLPRKSEEHRED
jgi:hypothetical protein